MEIVTTENLRIGAKVIRGPDWDEDYLDQDKDSIYGIIEDRYDDHWCSVSWIDQFHNKMEIYDYRIDVIYDLYYYEELPNIMEQLTLLEKKYEKSI